MAEIHTDNEPLNMQINSHETHENALKSRSTKKSMLVLDEYGESVLRVLNNIRNENEPTTRDEIIDALFCPGSGDFQTRVQKSQDYHSQILNRLDKVNKIYNGEIRNTNNLQKQNRFKHQINSQRFRLPLHLQCLIDLYFYKRLSISTVSEKLGIKEKDFLKKQIEAVSILSGLIK